MKTIINETTVKDGDYTEITLTSNDRLAVVMIIEDGYEDKPLWATFDENGKFKMFDTLTAACKAFKADTIEYGKPLVLLNIEYTEFIKATIKREAEEEAEWAEYLANMGR